MGHDWSLDLGGNWVNDWLALILPIVAKWQTRRQNMQAGSATFSGLFQNIPDTDTNEPLREQEAQT